MSSHASTSSDKGKSPEVKRIIRKLTGPPKTITMTTDDIKKNAIAKGTKLSLSYDLSSDKQAKKELLREGRLKDKFIGRDREQKASMRYFAPVPPGSKKYDLELESSTEDVTDSESDGSSEINKPTLSDHESNASDNDYEDSDDEAETGAKKDLSEQLALEEQIAEIEKSKSQESPELSKKIKEIALAGADLSEDKKKEKRADRKKLKKAAKVAEEAPVTVLEDVVQKEEQEDKSEV